jgi:protocatechuate 3,4-dioxygenase beta subunit
MERKEFLKRLGMSSLIVPLLQACSSDDDETTNVGDCTSTSSETAGPFPTKDPSSLELVDIRSDRTGVPFTMKIIIQNKNNDCAPLADAIVDIWHCDKDGYYSEYGGTTLQTVNFTSVHFLRGRQTTDSNGLVGFTSIFPGWYPSRAPHIHVHIYNASGTSLLVTQIAFPADVTDTVYTTAAQYYTKGEQDTSNTADSIFSNSIANELATVTGNVTDGYVLTHTIVVNA